VNRPVRDRLFSITRVTVRPAGDGADLRTQIDRYVSAMTLNQMQTTRASSPTVSPSFA
jgi:hypothetical protein